MGEGKDNSYLEKYSLGMRSLILLGKAVKVSMKKFSKNKKLFLAEAKESNVDKIPHAHAGPVRINNHSYVWR